jgi:hypothetical protein
MRLKAQPSSNWTFSFPESSFPIIFIQRLSHSASREMLSVAGCTWVISPPFLFQEKAG